MAINLEGIVTWLKGWFYDKSEVNTIANSKLNANLTTANKNLVTNGSGDVVLEDKPVIPDVSGKIDTAGTGLSKSGTTLNHSNSIIEQTSPVFRKFKYDAQGHITGTANVSESDLPTHTHIHTHTTSGINDPNYNNYSNITSSSNVLADVLQGIDSAIGDMASIHAIEVVSTLPTASSDTMGKLYIISENSKVNVYYTEQSGSSYSWHKMDTDILDDLSVAWNDITGKPSTFTPSSHNHEADEVYDGDYQLYSYLITIGLLSGNQQQNINSAIDHAIGSHDATLQSLDTSISGKAPTSHSSSATTYGVGTTSNYGHNKVINDLNHNSFGNGESLSAYQGYVLKNAINGKQDTITSIVLVPKSTDANGKIVFYTGDEPS